MAVWRRPSQSSPPAKSETLPGLPRAALVDASRRGGLSVSSEGTHSAELPGLSIVLPCLNEVGNLADTVHDALLAADRVSARVEVVIVDDGSTDGTGELAVKLAEGRVAGSPRDAPGQPGLRRGGAHRHPRRPDAVRPAHRRRSAVRPRRPRPPRAPARERRRRGGLQAAPQRPARPPRSPPRLGTGWCARSTAFPSRTWTAPSSCSRATSYSSSSWRRAGPCSAPSCWSAHARPGATVAEVGVPHYPRLSGKPSGGSPRVVVRAFRELARLHHSLHRAAARAQR